MDEIFIEEAGGGLRAVKSAAYDAEAVLQELLATYPDLLGGRQIEPDEPPRWLLIAREVGVPDAADASDRWALDHLFVDDRGVPTLVEVKRAVDTRLRREVVGQMLDYAANALVYWRVERLRATLAGRLGGADQADAAVDELTGHDDAERFWSTVEDNLRTGRMRMVFVADSIPTELQRIVEYLNEHLRQADVLAVEVKRYEKDELRAYVSRVIGQTGAAKAEKRATGRDERSFEERLAAASEAFRQCLDLLVSWADANDLEAGNTPAYWTATDPASGAVVLWARPTLDLLMLDLSVLPATSGAADRIVQACDEIRGRQAGRVNPSLKAQRVIKNWDRVKSDILDPLLHAIRVSTDSVGR